MQSSLYVGTVMHQRHRPKKHLLKYKVFSLLLDLEELSLLSQNLHFFSYNAFNLFSFHDRDFGNGNGSSLIRYVRKQLASHGMRDISGPIRLLAYPRILGFVFNPLAVYYCYKDTGKLGAVLYEVNNTFGQRHSYLIPIQQDHDEITLHQCKKQFYVSPFVSMDTNYQFRVEAPTNKLHLEIRETNPEGKLLDACFSGLRQEITDWTLLRLFFTHPLMTLKVVLGIHWEALKLWMKKIPLVPRPDPPKTSITFLD